MVSTLVPVDGCSCGASTVSGERGRDDSTDDQVGQEGCVRGGAARLPRARRRCVLGGGGTPTSAPDGGSARVVTLELKRPRLSVP